jgi:hypothetical protein
MFSPDQIPAIDAGMAARHSHGSVEHYTPIEVIEAARATVGELDVDPASCELANRFVKAKRFFSEENSGWSAPWGGSIFLNPPGGHCDEIGRKVIHASGGVDGCVVTGACGLAPGRKVPAATKKGFKIEPGHEHLGTDSSQKAWWFNFARRWLAGTDYGFFICFSVELLQSSQVDTPTGLPIPLDFPICYPRARLAYRTDRLPGPTPSNPNRKPTKKQIEDFRLTGTCTGDSPPHSSCIIFLPDLRDTLRVSSVCEFAKNFADIGKVVPTTNWND